jgi:hypothetical protein
LDPYVGAGAGVLIAATSSEGGGWSESSTAVGYLGVLRVGAAFGEIGGRPFIELRGSAGRVDGAGYSGISAVVGYRFEIIGEAAAN